MNNLEQIAKEIRRLVIETVVPEVTHHIGSSLSEVEILTALYFEIMNINPADPEDENRDRFILSKGHGALALYCTLYKKGFFGKDVLDRFDKDNSEVIEHANHVIPGVELSTGSLGHGLCVGNGMALSFKKDKKANRVYVLMSDGELNEGSNWEAFMFAAHHKLNNLTAIVDLNGFQGYGASQKVMQTEPLREKLEAFGWDVAEVDGHNLNELVEDLKECKEKQKPQIVIAKTVKGKGVDFFEGKFESHYLSIDENKKKEILENLCETKKYLIEICH
jgi:transketolase